MRDAENVGNKVSNQSFRSCLHQQVWTLALLSAFLLLNQFPKSALWCKLCWAFGCTLVFWEHWCKKWWRAWWAHFRQDCGHGFRQKVRKWPPTSLLVFLWQVMQFRKQTLSDRRCHLIFVVSFFQLKPSIPVYTMIRVKHFKEFFNELCSCQIFETSFYQSLEYALEFFFVKPLSLACLFLELFHNNFKINFIH